ncbi:trimeric intracellular cation channel family protein [Saccharophagus sp. K07]|uniref:trimeric intracellular cation channel family protein n=1 Tax=Saccharophagus sp. K07 TaxID=2283636 RepID=UPI001652B3F4|nr:trimeric intracellular cation channel family protein [Saccharophagus sp. K07]MBC6907125.1 trimeric intracellular cation channel family protein [Saccharophagus sp. K07]
MVLYYLDLAGVAVFAATGVLATRDRNLDFFGVLMVATFTAIGGGTLRDLLLNRHPIFWIVDQGYLLTILAAVVVMVIYLARRPPPGALMLIADAFGLGFFAMSGAKLTLDAGHSSLIVVLMGVMTGVMGGILRDVITARVPLILQKEVYATAAIVGILVYLVLRQFIPGMAAFWAGAFTVIGLRLMAIKWGLNLPAIPTR